MIAPGANPLLDHVWGISHAEDRIWAEVAGIAPSTRPWERLLMIWQAYIDDSETNQATSVLAGYIATAEVWANFTTKWEPLLPYTLPSKSTDKRRFKMSEMWNHNREMVPAFQNVIVNHIPFALSCKINISDLTRAKDRLLREVRDRLAPALRVDPTLSVKVPVFSDLLENQYIFCFYALMDKFHTYRSEQKDNEAFTRLIPPHQKIDFYFDKHSQKKAIRDGWDAFMATRPPITKDLYGRDPIFVDDEEFYGVQAADFWAWWIRYGYEKGGEEMVSKIRDGDFGFWKADRHVPSLHISFNEDDILRVFLQTAELIYRVR